MLKLNATTTKGDHKVSCPESWSETSVDQFQRIVKEWDGQDWIKLFSILSGVEANDIETSTDHKLETALYQCIQFVFAKSELEDLPIPNEITLRPIWYSDAPLVCDVVKIPRKIGRMTIGQAIQARKLLEETRDIREAISSVTAIYFQPLIDRTPFDMMRAIEIEQVILKMPITKIYPIGFFLLRRLNKSGRKRRGVFHRIRNWLRSKRARR
jgi:hypothetical protein